MHSPPSGAPSPSSSTSSRSHLPRWSSMPPHFHLAAYSPALAPALSFNDYSAIETALACVTSLSNNNYAYKLFIHMNAQLSCTRRYYYCSMQFGHYPTNISLV
uniref:Pentatricopeptide repeat-containing protein n=1 Tax=Mesocestoides corti TaxID=53468 RepID=A0A5K3G1F1_MESCO